MWFERPDSSPVGIGPLRVESVGATRRIAADVAGTPVWIESSDAELRPAPEAFASAFLLPALHAGRALTISDPVDPLWLEHVGRLPPIFRRWWRYPIRAVNATTTRGAHATTTGAAHATTTGAARATTTPSSPANEPRGARALFFSGGVDSFYSLLRGGTDLDFLVAIHGFDVALDDRPRLEAVTSLVRNVAAERGLRPIVVRTNLRSHPLVAAPAWERAHGGVLAAIGHALGGEVSEVLISSSIATDREYPWGSHWKSDPLYSSASRRFRQVGMERRRIQKLREIAAEPLVRKHLRVCWENRAGTLNCQRCKKCLQTRLALADCGALEECATLDGPATLARDLDQLDRHRGRLRALTELAASPRLAPEIRAAAGRLLRRSRHAEQPWVRARRAVLRRVPWRRTARA